MGKKYDGTNKDDSSGRSNFISMMQKDSRVNKEILENAFADEGVVAEKKAREEAQHKEEVAQVAASLVQNTKQAK